jgi:fructose-bisphosphate aldolase class II
MPLVNLSTVLRPALKNKYAVGSFNVSDYLLLESILKASQKASSPVILSIAESHLDYLDLERTSWFIRHISASSSIPIVLNLDHGLHFETIILAIKNGFTSVMFDGSNLTFEENTRQTQEIVTICHAADISVEAELGGIGGDEGGGLYAEADETLFTHPELARDFVDRTGIDALAVAIGNVHGKYRGDPKLDFKRLMEIESKTKLPLVLHGGSGISNIDFKKAISLGISKINFYTGMASTALDEIQNGLSRVGQKYNDYPELILQLKKRIQEVVYQQITVFGSEGTAG